MEERPHLIIIGGGFAGLTAAKELKHTNIRITLIDRQNHHCFQPLLYQVATAALSTQDIAAPLRKILRKQSNVTVLMDEVIDIDVYEKTVTTYAGPTHFDFLIVAAGARTHYFDESWRESAPGLKTLSDATEIRTRLLLAFEAAERDPDPERRKQWLNFVVIGAGPTGVELAGAIAEIAKRTLTANFRTFDPGEANVYLIEGQETVLPTFPAHSLRVRAQEQLEDTGVIVETGVLVDSIRDGCVALKDGREIPTKTVIWAAGVRAEDIGASLDAERDRMGRVKVRTDLTIAGHPNIFVVGDLADCIDKNGVPTPGLAPAANQMGLHAAGNIRRILGGREPLPFAYTDKGQMATIGRSKAVAVSGPLRLSGFLAWLAWLFIHILYLIDFRNKFAVMWEWFYNYLSWQRAARVIVNAPPPPPTTPSLPPQERVELDHQEEAATAAQ